MTQVLKNRKGVTLVELLAVIVIMGIIAAIAVPAIGGLIENSRQKAAEAEYSNILDAARLYAQSEDNVTTFTTADLLSKNYITSVPKNITDAATGGATVVMSFDSIGNLTTTSAIYINGYLVKNS